MTVSRSESGSTPRYWTCRGALGGSATPVTTTLKSIETRKAKLGFIVLFIDVVYAVLFGFVRDRDYPNAGRRKAVG